MLPEVYDGNIKSDDEQIDWFTYDPGPDDDEELAETPQDVIDMLGFDPKDLFSE